MSVLEQKQQIERQINDLFRNVMSMSNRSNPNYAFKNGASVQDLLNMKNRLTEAFENAMQIRRNAINFNETHPNVRYHIDTRNRSLLQALFRNIISKFTLLRDIFLVRLQDKSQVDEIQNFLNSRIVTKIVGNAQPVPPAGYVRRARSPNARSPSAAQSPSAARSPNARSPSAVRRYSNRSSRSISPTSAARAPQVVSPENVIVNESPQQPGCFGRMCASMSRFSRNRVHPDVGGKRKLRRRTRRTRRGRRSRLH